MTQKDIETITQAINQLSSRIINTIVLRDYLFFDLDVSSKDECIKETVKLINEYISLPEDFLERVQTRESLASTEYNNRIAMPHPINMIDIPEFVAVARLQKPILWNEKNVQLVFLVCNRGEINTWVYEKLTKIIASSEISSSLIQAKSFNEFRDIIEKI
jgi:lichenan operon transcriptional antiterminator